MPGCGLYSELTSDCIRAGLACTPRLQKELIQLSFQGIYAVFEVNRLTVTFWHLTSTIVEMLYNRVSHDCLHRGKIVTNRLQNLSEKFPRLITDLATVCTRSLPEGQSRRNSDFAGL